MSHLSIKG